MSYFTPFPSYRSILVQITAADSLTVDCSNPSFGVNREFWRKKLRNNNSETERWMDRQN